MTASEFSRQSLAGKRGRAQLDSCQRDTCPKFAQKLGLLGRQSGPGHSLEGGQRPGGLGTEACERNEGTAEPPSISSPYGGRIGRIEQTRKGAGRKGQLREHLVYQREVRANKMTQGTSEYVGDTIRQLARYTRSLGGGRQELIQQPEGRLIQKEGGYQSDFLGPLPHGGAERSSTRKFSPSMFHAGAVSKN